MISASQVKRARECLRMWAWEHLSEPRLPREPNVQADLGLEVHKVGELYHLQGTMPDRDTLAGRVFLPALAHVPKPGTGRAEGSFEATISDVHYQGYIDLECEMWDLPLAPVPDHVAAVWDHKPSTPVIVDYKSVKALRRDRMLTGPGEFLNDPQALLYAVRTMVARQADAVYMRWLYLRTEGAPKALASDTLLRRAETVDAFGTIVHPIAAYLTRLREEKPNPKELPPSPSRCMKYGKNYPCPHIARCGLSEKEQLMSDSNLLEKLRAKKAAQVAGEDKPKAEDKPAPQAEEKGVNPPEAPKKPAARASRVREESTGSVVVNAEVSDAPSVQDVADRELGRAVRTLMRAFKGA